MQTNDPGIKWEERSGVGQSVGAPSMAVRGILGTAPRGPIYTPPLLLSWSDFEAQYGGFKDDDAGPLAAYAYFAQGARFLLYSRAVELTDSSQTTAAKHGSARLFDTNGYAALWVWSRYRGNYDGVTVSTQKASTSMTCGIGADIAAETMSFNVSASTITRAAASTWASAGYAVGQYIYVKSATANHAKEYLITALSSDVATVSPAPSGVGTTTSSSSVRCVGATCSAPTDFEPGDVITATGANGKTATMLVHTVNTSTGFLKWYSTSIADALDSATVKTASRHKVSVSVATPIGSSDTVIYPSSVGNFAVGMHVTVLPGDVADVQQNQRVPLTVTVTAVSDTSITVDGPIGFAVAASDGGSPAKKTLLVSQEFGIDVNDNGTFAESYRDLSLSSALVGDYVQDKLGDVPTYTVGSTIAYTIAAGLATNAVAATFVAGTSQLSDLKTGQVFKCVGANNNIAYIQLKSANAGTGAVAFDSIGLDAALTGTTNVYAVTMRIHEKSEFPQNISNLIVVDQASTALATSANSAPIHFQYPKAVVDYPLTGGSVGTTPASYSSILGSNTPGSKTGIYAWEDADDWTSLASFCIPGLITNYTAAGATKQGLDSLADAWAQDKGIVYMTDIPAAVVTAADARVYRTQTLALQSSQTALYYPAVRMQDPRSNRRILTMPASPFMLGLQAVMTGANGINTPPANVPLKGVVGLLATTNPTEHELLNDVGVNVILKKRNRGYIPMGARTLLSKDGTMRHFLNARQWLNSFRRAVETSFDVRLFGVANAGAYPFIRVPLEKYLEGEFDKGVFAPGSHAEAYSVKLNGETTTARDLEDGQINVAVAVAMAGAIEKIKFIVTGYSGSIRMTEV